MDECIFKSVNKCSGPKLPLTTSSITRINSVIAASKIYDDDLHSALEPKITQDPNFTIKCHRSCVSNYVSKTHLDRFRKRKSKDTDENDDVAVPKRARRSDLKTLFDFRQHCLFCTELCVMDFDRKHPNRWRRVVLCRTADRTGNKTFKQSIIDTCDARQDNHAHEVKTRVLSAVSDLHAADARYHKDCFVKFINPRSVAWAQKKTESSQKAEEECAFDAVVCEMNKDRERIWNSVDVHLLYESKEGILLSRKTLVAKLSQHFGSDLLVLSGKGVANILVFRSKASCSLRLTAKEEDDEIDIAIETVAKRIQDECKGLAASKRHYNARIDMQEALSSVCPTLLSLLAKLSNKLERTMPTALIGNIVTSLLTNSTTPLQIALGVVLGKRSLIERLNEFAVACTYDELQRFKASAAAAAIKCSKLSGLKTPTDGLLQVVADNFDANISSQNGLVHTHSLAMMLTVFDANRIDEDESDPDTFPRLSTQEARNVSIEDIRIERYNGPKKPDMPEKEALRTVMPLRVLAHQVAALSRASSTDFAFLHDVVTKDQVPEFNGYNTKLAREQGHSIKPHTRAIYRPLIDMSPADPDTMLTAMVNAQEVTNSCGQEVTIFTNDQQLYKVTVGIKWAYPDRFLHFIPRLGGMHFLMSFIGSVGTLMANTGIEEILKAAFGGVSHMLSGKKFPQNARALRLLVEEVISSTVKNVSSAKELIVSLDSKAERSKTAMLWVECLIKPVFLMMLYVRAEREADWPLHLHAVKEMLPYFFAAGHQNYARYGTYYLHSMERLPTDVLQQFMEGYHVMRHRPGIWNAIWSDMFIESTFMRYGHGVGGIIGITLNSSALKKWAFSMHIFSQLEEDVTEMTKGYKETEVTTHKEEKPSRMRADEQDRLKIREKLQMSIDPLEASDHPDAVVNVVSGLISPANINVQNAVVIGNKQKQSFEKSLPSGFYGPISKQVVTMNAAKRSVKVGGKDVYDVNLIYSRVLGLQQSRDIDLADILRHELSPLPTSLFKETGELRIATGKSSLKQKLKVTVSGRHVHKPDTVVVDGCAILWCVHWPCNALVKDFVNNFCTHIIQRTTTADVYLVFDRYFDYSIKSGTRSSRSGQQASRRHQLGLSSPLPSQKVTLTVTSNKEQLIDLICSELLEKRHEVAPEHMLVVTGKDPVPMEIMCDLFMARPDLLTNHEEADVIMIQQVARLARSGAKAVTVVSDDTDVFILLLHFYAELGLTCSLVMEATGSDRTLIDIPATVKKHAEIVPDLLAMHCLSGCDTVGQMYGIGKGTALKAVTAGNTLRKLGCTESSMSDVTAEATQFVGHCFGTNKNNLSDMRVEIWSKKMSKKRVTAAPELKTLPPTSEAFLQNVYRAHFQAGIWRSAAASHPPDMDATEYGWSKDSASRTLMPVTMASGVELAPPNVLEMIKCGCASEEPCRNAHCKCNAAHLPCTFFCACRSGPHVCNNQFNKQRDVAEANEDDDDENDEDNTV